MNVNDWFKNGCNYNDGVMLYRSIPTHSKNLLRLFLLKESRINIEKLRYELSKFKTSNGIIVEASTVADTVKHISKIAKTSFDAKLANAPANGFYRLNQLPMELHEVAMKQRNNFQEAISLKLQLNNLLPEQEIEALKLCIAIEDLFDAIDGAQKTLDYYVKHKIVLQIAGRNYESFTPAQLVSARMNKRASITKHKKRVEMLKQKFGQNLSKNDKSKLEVQLQRATENLLKHEMELQQLNEIINKG